MKRILPLLLATALLASACTAAPNLKVMAQKNTDKIVQLATTGMAHENNNVAAQANPALTPVQIAKSPLYEILSAPMNYRTQITPSTDKLEITVDADVILPNVAVIPTVRVQARDFTQDEVTRFLHALCGSTVMYKNRTQSTRSEIQERIDDIKARMETAEGYDLEKLRENLAYYEKDYTNAPETIVDEVTDGKLYEKQLGIREYLAKYKALDVQEFPEEFTSGKTFSVQNNYYDINTKSDYDYTIGAGMGYSRQPLWGSMIGMNPIEYIKDESVVPSNATGELKITPLEARNLVQSFFTEHGFTDMAVLSVYLADNHETESSQPNKLDPYGQKHVYAVTCGKSVNGLIPISIDAIYDDLNWSYESCCFFVSDDGIDQFQWVSPNEYVETVTDNTVMLAFGRIDEIFRKMMLVKYESATSESETCKLFSYHVNRVALEWQRILEQGSKGTGLLIPVWNFYGAFDYRYTDGTHFDNNDVEQGLPKPLLSINAIDGSIIDRQQGY